MMQGVNLILSGRDSNEEILRERGDRFLRALNPSVVGFLLEI